ncbi:MAG: hypothetical protein ABR579_09940 [Actinomycetota bacterium]
MRKALVTLLSIALIGGAIAAPAAQAKKAKKPKSVTEHGDYQSPQLVVLGGCANTGAVGCVTFTPAGTKLTYVSVTVTDSSGLPVFASIEQPDGTTTAGAAANDALVASFCGKTTAPVAINPAQEVHIWISPTPDPSCVPAVATTGTVDVTFQAAP